MPNVNGARLSGSTTGADVTLVLEGSDTNIGLTVTPKGTGQFTCGGDLSASGGYRQQIDGWYQDNVSASQTAVVLARNATPGFGDKFIPCRAGSITGIIVKSNAARVGGTLTVEVYKNAAGTGLTAVLDGTNTTVKATLQAKDTDTFAAGDELDVRITTDGSWSPTTADIRVSIEIET